MKKFVVADHKLIVTISFMILHALTICDRIVQNLFAESNLHNLCHSRNLPKS